jgi:oxygen-independent coproporphyrinogen-3 oxidase
MTPETILRYSAPVPRYTSYPTAPHFDGRIGERDYVRWLESLGPATSLSLYLHIPFCDTLCWFCGCHTKMTRRHAPVSRYAQVLEAEIAAVAAHVGDGAEVSAVHWGGGSPTLLAPREMTALAAALRDRFTFAGMTEFAVEIDPRGFDIDRARALAEAGLTRASIGVQDFDLRVQRAINRIQSVDETRVVVEMLRRLGVTSINIDLMYGLPHQTLDTIAATIDAVLVLAPERIAVFGYAHVPWMKRHQTMIDDDALPSTLDRFAQADFVAARLADAGYVAIGLDHFARPDDPLAAVARDGRMRRNFQGYTADDAATLIGLGASAIGRLPQGYVQNEVATAAYEQRIVETGLAIAKGIALDDDDRLRARVIERLMCDLTFSESALTAEFGRRALPVIAEARAIAAAEADGLVARTPDGFRVTETGRPFVRTVCSRFDAYLARGTARHSAAV